MITGQRKKLLIVTAACALTTAAAASAATAAWASGSRATTPAATAFSAITVRSGQTAADQDSSHYLAAQQVRATAEQQALTVLAHQQAAAHQATVVQAAKREAQAELAAQQVAAQQVAARQAQQAPQPSAQQSSGQRTAQQTASQQAPSAAPLAPTGSAQSIAESMLGSFGWSSSQSSCLQPLWAGESGWSVTASNPSTGAYGIPQALPGSKMASAGTDWQTSAATQIRWGLGYIENTYGSPCAAWSHEQADGWY
jgi:hypothetical protein